MADGVISYEDAIGASPVPAAAVPAPASAPADAAPSDMASYADRPLTVHARAPSPPTAPVPDAPPTDPVAPAASGIISYEDATTPTTPNAGGALSNAADDSYTSGGLKGLATAAIKGVAHIPGVAGDAMDFADYLVARAQAKITGRPLEEIQKQQKADQTSAGWTDPRNWVPAGPTLSDPVLKQTGEYVPTTEAGKVAQGAVEAGLGGMVGGVGLAPMAMNAAAGAVGQGVTDYTGDPLLGAAAGFGGGALAHGGAAAVNKIAAPALMGVPGIDRVPVIGPAVSAARDNKAAAAVLAEARDPASVKAWAAQPAAPSDVPNSPQTLAGAVGDDMGLYQAEKAARNVDNTPFNLVDKAQSNAAQAAIPVPGQENANVFRPGQVIRDRLNAIDAASEAAQERLAAAHQDAVTNRQMATQAFADQQRAGLADRTIARGEASGDAKAQSDAVRQAAHDRLVASFQDANARATQTAVDAAAPLRELPTPEATGAAYRVAQQEATDASVQAKRALYKAVDPDGTLATVVTPLKEAKNAIEAASVDPNNSFEQGPAEAKIWSDIDKMPDVIPFKSLQTLDTRVTAAMKEAKQKPNAQDPNAVGRLTQLKSAVMDAIHNGVENQASHEARMVDAGVMPADHGMEARLLREWGLEDQRSASSTGVVARTGTGPSSFSGGGASGRSRSFGAGNEAGGQFREAPGNPGVSQASLTPNFDPAAVERLNAAKAAHIQVQQDHNNPTVAPVIKTNGYAGQYTMENGAIPSKIAVKGDQGFETANRFLTAAGNDPRAVTALQNSVIAPLAKNMPPAGNLHPNALARLKQDYAGTLRAIDAVSPGFSSRFDNAASATQTVLDMAIQQRQELATTQREAAREAFIENAARRDQLGQATAADRTRVSSLLAERASDDRAAVGQSRSETSQGIAQAKGIARDAYNTPAGQFATKVGNSIAADEVQNAVGSMMQTGTQGATNMRSFVASLDPDALAGTQKAGTDWMVREFQNADGSMSGAKFINFVRDNKNTLKELYPTSQVSMFGAIADKLQADARWRTDTNIKGGSDSGKNLLKALEKNSTNGAKHTSMAVIAIEAMREGFDRGGWDGAALAGGGAAAAYLLGSLRSAGIKSVAQLYQTMLADPEKARYLISKMPETPEGGKLRALTGSLRRSLLVGQEQSQHQARDKALNATHH